MNSGLNYSLSHNTAVSGRYVDSVETQLCNHLIRPRITGRPNGRGQQPVAAAGWPEFGGELPLGLEQKSLRGEPDAAAVEASVTPFRAERGDELKSVLDVKSGSCSFPRTHAGPLLALCRISVERPPASECRASVDF